MTAEITDQELSDLALRIYWMLEHGQNKEAVSALRKLINDSQNPE